MRDIIIVGSQGAIGNHLAQAFAPNHRVYGTFHETFGTPVKGLAKALRQIDVSSFQWCSDFVGNLEDGLGDQVVLINAFGISIDGMGHKLPQQRWEHVLSVNLIGTSNICRAILPLMREKMWGRIINLSSVVAHVGVPGTSAYAASKAGIEALTRTLAVENATKGITVNALALGYMGLGLIDTIGEDLRENIRRHIPVGYFGHPDNIIGAVQFLMDADYVTGTSIVIDGGFLCT